MPEVHGPAVDNQTRCVHYASEKDIVAIKFACCGKFYPCYQCHQVSESHTPERWSKDAFDTQAILCGSCSNTLRISDYLNTIHCPHCQAAFNPGCQNHYHLYFDYPEKKSC